MLITPKIGDWIEGNGYQGKVVEVSEKDDYCIVEICHNERFRSDRPEHVFREVIDLEDIVDIISDP